jgi:sugar phosphate isomerase/epimerase
MQSAIQLHSLRDVDESVPALLDRVGATNFAGVEFATRVDEASPADVATRLGETGLVPVAAQVPIEDLEDDVGAVVERATAIGYDDVVVPWLDPEHFATVDAVEDAADRLSVLAGRLAEEGLTLYYHNHDQEFQETEDGPAIHVLADRAPDVGLQVDTGCVLLAGEDPVDFLRLYEDRISLVHLKDVSPGSEEYAALGEGDLDLDGVARAARDADADWLIFESGDPEDPLAELERASDVVSRLV